MNRLSLFAIVVLIGLGVLLLTGFGSDGAFWSQWGRNAQHTGMVSVPGQPLNNKLADIVYDPFTGQEKAESVPIAGEAVLLVHYQATLIDGNSFYMMQKSGSYPSCPFIAAWVYGLPCGPNGWNQVQWNVVRRDWVQGMPVTAWTFSTDWKPEPNATNYYQGSIGLGGWEPVFHPALANGFLYVPGAGGTVWKVDESTGQAASHINPFTGKSIDPANTYVSSPLTADDNGNITVLGGGRRVKPEGMPVVKPPNEAPAPAPARAQP